MAGRLRRLAHLKGTQMIRWRETKQQTNNNNNKQRSPLMFNKRLYADEGQNIYRERKWKDDTLNEATNK
jgi:hypothetical protein